MRALTLADVATFWLGVQVALAIEARVKFSAESLTREVGLDVGRQVFAVFGWFELVLLAVALMLVLARPPRNLGFVLLAVAMGAVVLQAAWLRPALNMRVARIIGGGTPAESPIHVAYLGIEFVKLVALAVLTRIPSSPVPS